MAADLRDSFADGCWLVQLSPLRAPELLARTVSEALGLPDEAAGDAPQVLAQNLAERELLLLLDTCEHLTEACAELAALLLAAAPGLRILATSRSPLGLPDEHTVLITPLDLPAADDAAAAHADAVTLFVDRARAAVPGFALTPENTPAVAELCRRLDGIPLALELAAVRLRGMPVEEILARLSDRFRVLGTARTVHRPAPHAARRGLLELRAVHAGRAAAVGGAVGVPRRLRARGGRVRLRSGHRRDPAPAGRQVGHPVVPGGATARAPGRVPTGTPGPLPAARHDAGVRRGAPDAAGAAAAGRVRARHRDYYLGLAERAAAGSMTAGQTAWLTRLGAETAQPAGRRSTSASPRRARRRPACA